MKARFLAVKNLAKYQHYGDRNPPWIKLHRSFLSDYSLHQCSVKSRLFFACMLLLASETDNHVPFDLDYLSQRVGFLVDELDISPLISKGLLLASRASTVCSGSPLLSSVLINPNPNESPEQKSPPIPIPEDWVPSEKHDKLAKSLGLTLAVEANHFKGKAQEKGWVTIDWGLKFRNWLLQEAKFREARKA